MDGCGCGGNSSFISFCNTNLTSKSRIERDERYMSKGFKLGLGYEVGLEGLGWKNGAGQYKFV